MSSTCLAVPAAAHVAMPHRKLMRGWLSPVTRKSTRLAIGLVAIDLLLYLLASALVVLARSAVLQVLGGLAMGFVIARLFVLGHDACHQSFTRHRSLNRWLARLLFLPSLTPCSLWEVGHNVVHHGYTNLKGFDFVWEPQSLSDYRAMPAGRRRLERLYRSGWAPWLYYLVEVWWKRMLFPNRRLKEAQRLLESRMPGRIVVQRFSWRWYADTARRCKLYDFDARCWTDFQGRPTAAA